jgi:hypothetical protein
MTTKGRERHRTGTGFGLFVFCVLSIFYLIHRNVGR